MSVNKVIIVGRLGNDPELKEFSNGGKIANLSVATSERWTDKQTGEQKEQTEWHRVVLRDNLANIAGQYLQKGSQVYIEGKIKTRQWDDNGVTRHVTEVIAFTMQMLGSSPNSQSQNQAYAPQQGYQGQLQQGYAPQQPQQQAYAQQPMVQPSPMTSMQRPPSYGHAPQQPQQGYQQPQQGYQGQQPQQGYAINPAPAMSDDDMPF